MAPPRCDKRLENLIVNLRDSENYSWSYIAKHVNMSRKGVRKIYERNKNPPIIKTGGKRRSTDVRYVFLILAYHLLEWIERLQDYRKVTHFLLLLKFGIS